MSVTIPVSVVTIVVIVVSLWCAADNVARRWGIQSVGEDEYAAFVARALRRCRLSTALTCCYAKSGFIAAIGVLLCLIGSKSTEDLSFWFGAAIVTVAAVNAYLGTITLLRRYKNIEKIAED